MRKKYTFIYEMQGVVQFRVDAHDQAGAEKLMEELGNALKEMGVTFVGRHSVKLVSKVDAT